MGGIRKRGSSYEINYRDADGTRHFETIESDDPGVAHDLEPDARPHRVTEVGGRPHDDEDARERYLPAIGPGEAAEQAPDAPSKKSGHARAEFIDLLRRDAPPAVHVRNDAQAVTSSSLREYS